MANKYLGFVGTYTRQSSKGIYKFILDADKKTIEQAEVAAEVGSPTYLSISQDQRYLYAVAQDDDLGGVASFSIDSETGKLQEINRILKEGAPPCHVEARDGKLLSGNYHLGTVDLYHISDQGSISSAVSVVEHQGNGPHERQEKPHVHYTGHTPDGKYIVVADLGTDELVTYKIENDALVRVHTLKVKAGSGPRHIAFHPSGQWAYLLTELQSEVVVLKYHEKDGSFTEEQYISALPIDFKGTNDASAIHITSDGKYLYTGNRGHNSIALFEIDESTGKLTFVEHTPTGGEWPRDFVLDPSESFIVAANQHTGNLVLFERDKATGKLTKLPSEIEVPEAVCVKFLG